MGNLVNDFLLKSVFVDISKKIGRKVECSNWICIEKSIFPPRHIFEIQIGNFKIYEFIEFQEDDNVRERTFNLLFSHVKRFESFFGPRSEYYNFNFLIENLFCKYQIEEPELSLLVASLKYGNSKIEQSILNFCKDRGLDMNNKEAFAINLKYILDNFSRSEFRTYIISVFSY